MGKKDLLPNLFRAEYQKIVSVLINLFGIHYIEIAEDLVGDTFLSATESWAVKGVPENPEAWLYTVAKNKTKNYLKRNAKLEEILVTELQRTQAYSHEIELDLSEANIADSQLAMIFAVCNPLISGDAQVSLALNLLCGFGASEIADAYLTNREVIYKRINRAKTKLKEHNVRIGQPYLTEIDNRLQNVLKTLYLLFSEGYYSSGQDTTIRKEMCSEAMRLGYLLSENKATGKPDVFALMALMCFHASRLEARTGDNGEAIMYDDQDEQMWNKELIEAGEHFLNKASVGDVLSKYHIEAAIAYWHTQKADLPQKWQNILKLYDQLLLIENSPMAALNRAYALYKVEGHQAAIEAVEKLHLADNHFYHSFLGTLYSAENKEKAIFHYQTALSLAKSATERNIVLSHIGNLNAA